MSMDGMLAKFLTQLSHLLRAAQICAAGTQQKTIADRDGKLAKFSMHLSGSQGTVRPLCFDRNVTCVDGGIAFFVQIALHRDHHTQTSGDILL